MPCAVSSILQDIKAKTAANRYCPIALNSDGSPRISGRTYGRAVSSIRLIQPLLHFAQVFLGLRFWSGPVPIRSHLWSPELSIRTFRMLLFSVHDNWHLRVEFSQRS